MSARVPKAFLVARPWLTAEQQANRIARLVALLWALQFVLNALQLFLGRVAMIAAWLLGSVFVGTAAFRIEKYFSRRRRGPW